MSGAREHAYLRKARFSGSPSFELPPLRRYMMTFANRRLNNVDSYEKKDKVGQGTFGEVFKGRCRRTGRAVAIKRFVTDRSRTFPITEIREVMLLRRMRNNPNLTELIEVVRHVDHQTNAISYFMVMPYYEADLVGLLTSKHALSTVEKKTIFQQILKGLSGLHKRRIIHRDLKTANIMLSGGGIVKIGDFGLARPYNDHSDRFTPTVVTLWYRSPELLLGSCDYHTEVDMWSAGCVLGELYSRQPILPGESDIQQLKLISNLCGPLNEQSIPGFAAYPMMASNSGIEGPTVGQLRIKDKYQRGGPELVDLLTGLLTLDPKKRLTAEMALKHQYFDTRPYVLADVKEAVARTPPEMRFEYSVRKAAQEQDQMKLKQTSLNQVRRNEVRPHRASR